MEYPSHAAQMIIRAHSGPAHIELVPCALCWGQRSILEPSPFGLLPVVCERCQGHGKEARLRTARSASGG